MARTGGDIRLKITLKRQWLVCINCNERIRWKTTSLSSSSTQSSLDQIWKTWCSVCSKLSIQMKDEQLQVRVSFGSIWAHLHRLVLEGRKMTWKSLFLSDITPSHTYESTVPLWMLNRKDYSLSYLECPHLLLTFDVWFSSDGSLYCPFFSFSDPDWLLLCDVSWTLDCILLILRDARSLFEAVSINGWWRFSVNILNMSSGIEQEFLRKRRQLSVTM